MAQPVFSTRLLGGSSNVGLVTYIVPLGFTVVIRQFDAVTEPTSGCNLLLFVAGFNFFIRQLGFEPQFSYTTWSGRQVANEGELIHVDTTDTTDFSLSGYLLLNS